MTSKRWLVALLIGCATGAAPVGAEVLSHAPQGFVVARDLILDATPDRAFEALTADVGAWWDPAHSYSGDARNFSLDAQAGGCFCERLPDGGSVEHMRVIFAQPGKLLRLAGGLGPLQGMGATGVMEFTLAPDGDDRSRLEFRYVVGGYTPDGLESLAEPVDAVLGEQLARLARYLEKN